MSSLPTLAMDMGVVGPFPVIVADPPWLFQSNSEENPGRNARSHYDCQPTEDIARMPIGELCGKDSTLYLWTTSPMLPEGLHVLESWGFTYKSQMVWIKPSISTGYHNRNQHELVLVGRRGKGPLMENRTSVPSVFYGPKREHSRKPDQFAEIIESGYPNFHRLDLFARQRRSRLWTAWGNEIAHFDLDENLEEAA